MGNKVIENHKRQAEGWFKQAGPVTKELVQDIVAHYHLRTDKRHNDGSIGEVKITPLELHDLVTYVMVMTKMHAQQEAEAAAIMKQEQGELVPN
jgi:hypothetical protein